MDPRDLPPMPDLMIVGPGPLHEQDLAVLGGQVIAHYGDVWMELFADAQRAVAELVGSSAAPYLIPGSGTACLDAAMMNLFRPGDVIVVPETGFFGSRLAEVAQANRLEVRPVSVEIGKAVDLQRIAEAARGAAAVAVTHVETATGVRHPVDGVAQAAHDAGALCLVDGIASVGGELVDVDHMGLDVLVSSTQKGMESPPGLGVIALGADARARLAERSDPVPSWYLDLKRWDWYGQNWGWHPHPVTMPTSLVLTLLSSLRRILAVGTEQWVAQRAALARALRDGIESLGFEPVPAPDVQSNMVVAAHADDAPVLQKRLLDEGIQISGGLAPLAGRSIRIGLMGRTATLAMVERVLDALDRARKGTATQ